MTMTLKVETENVKKENVNLDTIEQLKSQVRRQDWNTINIEMLNV